MEWHCPRKDAYPFGVSNVSLCEHIPLLSWPHTGQWSLNLLPILLPEREGFNNDETALQSPLQLCPWQGLQLLLGQAGNRDKEQR